MRRRLLHGLGANALAQMSNTAIQLISAPIYLSYWSLTTYGLWVLLATLPSYAALMDLGLTTASANDMTLSVAAGDQGSAVRTYRSLWLMVSAAGAAAVCLAAALLWLLPAHLFPSSGGTVAQIRLTALLLTLYAVFALQSSVLLAGYRAAGLYAQGVLIAVATAVLETATSLALVIGGGGTARSAAGLLCVRALSLGVLYGLLTKRVPWLTLAPDGASLREIRRLLPAALAALAIPLAFAVTLQGMVVAVGFFGTAAAAAIYVSVRTISRLPFQVVAGVSNAVMPEFTLAVGRRDMVAATRLVVFNVVATGVILIPAAVVLGVAGSWVIRLWTRGAIDAPRMLVFGMAAATCLHGLWHLFGNLLLAINRHAGYAKPYPVLALIAVLGGGIAVRYGGLSWVVLPSIVLEGVMLAIVWKEFNVRFAISGQQVREAIRAISVSDMLRGRSANRAAGIARRP